MIGWPYTDSALSALTTLKVLHHEIEAAGIPKQDSRGDAVDLHSLRVTFALMLPAGGALWRRHDCSYGIRLRL